MSKLLKFFNKKIIIICIILVAVCTICRIDGKIPGYVVEKICYLVRYNGNIKVVGTLKYASSCSPLNPNGTMGGLIFYEYTIKNKYSGFVYTFLDASEEKEGRNKTVIIPFKHGERCEPFVIDK